MRENIGKICTMNIKPDRPAFPMYVQFRIMDYKTAYGQSRYLITPVSGTGEQWVSADRVQITEVKP
jgi:hypothetical protein